MENFSFPSKIRVAVLNISYVLPLKTIGNKLVADGCDGKLLDTLAEKLNFEYELVQSPDNQWGSRNENGTWNGIVGLIQSGKADFAMPGLGITEERWEDIDFSLWYTLLEKVFATKEPGEMPKITAFTYPFTRNAWILYVFMTITAAVLFQRMLFKNATLWGSFISVLGSIVGQAIENVRETPWKRVLFGTVDRELLRRSGIEYLENLGEVIEKNDWKFPFGKEFVNLLNEPSAVIMPRTGIDLLLGSPPYISIKTSLDNIGVWYVGIGLQKNFCCRERLNFMIYGINSGGLFEKWIRDQTYVRSLRDRLNVKHEIPEMQLTLTDLKLAFFVLSFGYVLAFLTLLAELLTPNRFDIFFS
ncbi:uncharacterized protein TNCV_2267591 [Trichonephila clavipes]|nr:uncharacterized protein TNCV_2267591 [Trichonephila clavipes]